MLQAAAVLSVTASVQLAIQTQPCSCWQIALLHAAAI